ASNFTGGINLATGDIDGDGKADIITGAGPGGAPHVRAFRADGTPLLGNGFFAYDTGFHGGVSVAAADLDGDGRADIVTGAGPGGGPHVKAFANNGTLLASFFAYAPNFGGGVYVSAAPGRS